jgi:hypothetical protein
MLTRIRIASVVFVGLIIPAAAVTPPTLPSSAKKLNGAEITALLDGATTKWESYAHDSLVTGTAKFDLKNHSQSGTWESVAKKKKGNVAGFVEVRDDKWCFKPDKINEFCNFIYTDGDSIYEVNDNHVVVAKDKKQ